MEPLFLLIVCVFHKKIAGIYAFLPAIQDRHLYKMPSFWRRKGQYFYLNINLN
jgi:hypothetical protein